MTTRLPTFGKLWYVAGRTTRNRWSTKAVANELFELAQRMVEVFLICQDFGIWTSPNYGIEDMNQAITEQKGASQMLPPADWWLQRTAVSITMRGLEFGNCSKTESLSMFCLLRKAERMLWFLFWQPLAQLVKGYYCSKAENLRNQVVSEARPESRNQGPGGQRATRATTKQKQVYPAENQHIPFPKHVWAHDFIFPEQKGIRIWTLFFFPRET